MLSMKALVGGWMVPYIDNAPRFIFSVFLIKKFTAAAMVMTEIVQPVMIPVPRSCQEVVQLPTVNFILNYK